MMRGSRHATRDTRRAASSGPRVIALAATALAIGCASVGTLPGGKEIKTPVVLQDLNPDSGSVNFKGRAVELVYDRVINDRGTGEQALEQQVIISPIDGDVRVSYGRERIAVRPRRGWRANTTYTVTVLPGVRDLRGNMDSVQHVTVFSTGPALATGTITGNVFDWVQQGGIARAWMQAIAAVPGSRDSITYVARADAFGGFVIGPLPEGEYLVRGFDDQNRNRGLDRGEMWDTTRVRVAASPVPVELLAVLRDTIPPSIAALTLTDSVTLAVKFDRPLDPAQPITNGTIRIVRADSTPIPVVAVSGRVQAEIAKRRADSLRAAAADTAPRRAAPPVPAPAPPMARRPGARDTLSKPRPRPTRPAPETELVVTLGAPLAPATSYRVTAIDVRNVVGRAASPSRILQVPKPKPPADSTKAPGDTTRTSPPMPRADSTARPRADSTRAVPPAPVPPTPPRRR
ncbi:MAG: Ig-like domain-containing domain [Gemmatimonadaceae bacterium]